LIEALAAVNPDMAAGVDWDSLTKEMKVLARKSRAKAILGLTKYTSRTAGAKGTGWSEEGIDKFKGLASGSSAVLLPNVLVMCNVLLLSGYSAAPAVRTTVFSKSTSHLVIRLEQYGLWTKCFCRCWKFLSHEKQFDQEGIW
jgi:hypothetical protein